MSIEKTPLNEEPFGIRALERLNIGDIVRWKELQCEESKMGVVFDLYLEKRGGRSVAIAKIHTIRGGKSNLSLLGEEKEVLVVNLEILSKGGVENE